MAKNSRSTVTVTVNGITHTIDVGAGGKNSVSVTTANGKTTITVNGTTIVAGKGGGNIVQSITTGTNNVVINNGTVSVTSAKSTGSARGTAVKISRSARKTTPMRRATPVRRVKPVKPTPKKDEISIEEIKNCFVELDVALKKGAKISDDLIRELAPCKTVMEKARVGQGSFKAYKEKMSNVQFPIYSMRKKPKPGEELYSDTQEKIKDGYAIISLGENATYEGVIFEGKMCGLGSVFTPKYSYAGYFENNRESGKGIYTLTDGTEAAVWDGYGIIIKNNDLVAFGQVKKYILNGFGVDLSNPADIKCGKFKNGELV